MSLRPYSNVPWRCIRQLSADAFVALWVVAWVWVGRFTHDAIASLAGAGYKIESGASGLARNLNSAGGTAARVPIVGDELGAPLRSAGGGASNVAGAGRQLGDDINTTATVVGLLVALVPIVSLVLVWATLRLRFAVRAGATSQVLNNTDGDSLLALRALTNRSLRQLATLDRRLARGEASAGASRRGISKRRAARQVRPGDGELLDGWRRDDPRVVHALADLELSRTGLRRRPTRQLATAR